MEKWHIFFVKNDTKCKMKCGMINAKKRKDAIEGLLSMKQISFEALYSTEFIISEVLAKPQYWAARGNVYNAFGRPKTSHTLLWFKNCAATITDIYGNVLEVEKNQLTYMSKGIEYMVEFRDTNTDGSEDTVVIHFQMTDRNGEDIMPIDRPIICMQNVDMSFAMDMDTAADEYKKNIVCVPKVQSIIYNILASVCQNQKNRSTKNKFACIRNGIELLEQDRDLSIAQIAEKCGVSECYFRRLFQEYSGESPMNFRQHHRMKRAKQLLLSDEYSTVGQVAQELNFSDIYHFSKMFKNYYGISPTAFVKQAKGEEQ